MTLNRNIEQKLLGEIGISIFIPIEHYTYKQSQENLIKEYIKREYGLFDVSDELIKAFVQDEEQVIWEKDGTGEPYTSNMLETENEMFQKLLDSAINSVTEF